MDSKQDFSYIAEMVYIKPSKEKLKEFIDRNPWANEPLFYYEVPGKEELKDK